MGSIFALMKANNYIRDFVGGISIDTYNSMHNQLELKMRKFQ